MKEADDNNYFIQMLGFDNNSLDSRTLERCVEWRLAGIIAIHAPETTMESLLPQIQATGIPFVMVDSQQRTRESGCPNITSDNEGGVRAVVEHLLALGHRRVAFLGGQSGSMDSISYSRERAYLETMATHDLEKECCVEYGDWCAEFSEWETGATAEAGRRLLDSPTRPTAIVCASDHLAMVVMRLAAQRGLRVPEALSVTGFDDVTVAALYNPPLTTVAQSFEEIGRAAVRHLLKPKHDTPQILPTRLLVRGSTAPPLTI
jgi:LacI family transcriptional regulator